MDTLKSTDLYRYFVSEKVITMSDRDEISSRTNPIERVELLLRKISSPLESGHTESFHSMLNIMSIYGNMATKKLARDITESLGIMDNGMYSTCYS